MEWNRNKNNIKKLKDSILYPSHSNGFGICVFWMLVGAVKQYDTLTYHKEVCSSCMSVLNQIHHITAHYSQVLVLSDFAYLCNHKIITSWKKKNKIWFKQGSGYHAISIHAELLNSYYLCNQILVYEMQQGTESSLSCIWTSILSVHTLSSQRCIKAKDPLASPLVTFFVLFHQCLLFRCDWYFCLSLCFGAPRLCVWVQHCSIHMVLGGRGNHVGNLSASSGGCKRM